MRGKISLLLMAVVALFLTVSITQAARVVTKNPYVVAAGAAACGTRQSLKTDVSGC